MRQLRDAGEPLEAIARELGITRQRVAQVLGPTGRVSRRYGNVKGFRAEPVDERSEGDLRSPPN